MADYRPATGLQTDDLGLPVEGITTMDVDPDLAQTWLEELDLSLCRHTDTDVLDRMVYDMEMGFWKPRGGSVKVDQEYRLHDGKRRLIAVVMAKQTVPMKVERINYQPEHEL